MCGSLFYFDVYVDNLPWEQACITFVAAASTVVLMAAGVEQLGLLARGLNVKQASRGPAFRRRAQRDWSCGNILSFCSTRSPKAFVPMRAHVVTDGAISEDEDVEEDDNPEVSLCGTRDTVSE